MTDPDEILACPCGGMIEVNDGKGLCQSCRKSGVAEVALGDSVCLMGWCSADQVEGYED